MADTFEIGLTFGGMVTLKSIGVKNPLDEPVSCSETRELADGSVLEVGWAVCIWHWDYIDKAQFTTLKNFFTTNNVYLYIKTRDDADAYNVYYALATFPVQKDWTTGNANARKVKDFSITFKKLVLVEEETS